LLTLLGPPVELLLGHTAARTYSFRVLAGPTIVYETIYPFSALLASKGHVSYQSNNAHKAEENNRQRDKRDDAR
jgi:hypothetical protein